MKISVQYVNDSAGRLKSVQIPVSDWEKLVMRLEKFEQTQKLKNGIKEAFKEVAQMRKTNANSQTLKDFLNEL